ncbi:SHOCT domain-containing protein [Sphingomonas yabuuchiae]|uniref:SHOCT domain-containing protein n=1 Tax=Sphingomonas yabuuchiae TaxID=172044 RepID=A0AA40ZVM5_9SPHN|nr:SHOCT domain-containing protein [Sphingomonas yabuuchiae]MBB4611706.1 hypothetical protein [Sphingomonas yabuuchiae]MBN3556776.1 SHOCT domain-containing protein [Sphingomonas yabuuchiae]
MTDIVAKLERLKALKDQGAMDESEYRAAKTQILSASSNDMLDRHMPPQPSDEVTPEWEDQPVPFWKRLLLGLIIIPPLLAASIWFGFKVAPSLLGGVPANMRHQCVAIGPGGITVASFNQPLDVFLAGLKAEKINVTGWDSKGEGLYALQTEKEDALRNRTDKMTFLFREKEGGGGSTCGPNSLLMEGIAENGVAMDNFVTAAWFVMGRGAVALGIKPGELKTPEEHKIDATKSNANTASSADVAESMEKQADELDARSDAISNNAANEVLAQNQATNGDTDVGALWRREREKEKPTAAMRAQFAKYPAAPFEHGGDVAVPILTGGNPPNKNYKTALEKVLGGDPDFAGKYNIARLGCGMSCEFVKFIDQDTGTVIDLPSFLQPEAHRLIRQPESRLLKVVSYLDMANDKCRFTDLVLTNGRFEILDDKRGPCPAE